MFVCHSEYQRNSSLLVFFSSFINVHVIEMDGMMCLTVEAIIKTYVKTILFRVDPNDRRKLSSKIFNMAKGNKAAKEIRVSEDALNKIQGDAVLLKGFLIQTLGSDEEEGLIKDLVSIITDMIDFMAAPTDQLMTHTISKMESIPQSAPSIKDFLNGK